jgi:hypothetical protein
MPIAAPLCRPTSPGMIHENLPHGLSGNDQEMGPTPPINGRLTEELQVGFVNQRGRLKSMALSFPVHVSRGNGPQFGVDVRKQLLSGMAVPGFEFLQELSYPGRSARCHGRPTHQSLRILRHGIVAPANTPVKADTGGKTGTPVAGPVRVRVAWA